MGEINLLPGYKKRKRMVTLAVSLTSTILILILSFLIPYYIHSKYDKELKEVNKILYGLKAETSAINYDEIEALRGKVQNNDTKKLLKAMDLLLSSQTKDLRIERIDSRDYIRVQFKSESNDLAALFVEKLRLEYKVDIEKVNIIDGVYYFNVLIYYIDN